MAVPLELKSFTLLFKPRNIINNSLTSFLSVRTVSYGLFRSDLRPKCEGKKNSVRNLRYSSRTRLVRGTIWRMFNVFLSQKQVLYISGHNNLNFFFLFFQISFLHHNLRILRKSRGPLCIMFHAPFVMCILFCVELNFSCKCSVSCIFPWYVSSFVVLRINFSRLVCQHIFVKVVFLFLRNLNVFEWSGPLPPQGIYSIRNYFEREFSYIARKKLAQAQNVTSFWTSWWRLMNSEKWHMVKRTVIFIDTFLEIKRALCFFVRLRATRQLIPKKLTFYRRGWVCEKALVGQIRQISFKRKASQSAQY